MLCADLARALVIGALAVLVADRRSSPSGSSSVIVALYGVGTAFFTPAFEAIVPDIVPATDLAAANSLDQFVRPIALRLAGPALGRRARRRARARAPRSRSTPRPSSSRPCAVFLMRPPAHPRSEHVELVRRRREGGPPLRPAAGLAVGHAPLRRDRLPRLHGPGRGAAAVRRQERAPRLGRRPRTRLRGRRRRGDRCRARSWGSAATRAAT